MFEPPEVHSLIWDALCLTQGTKDRMNDHYTQLMQNNYVNSLPFEFVSIFHLSSGCYRIMPFRPIIQMLCKKSKKTILVLLCSTKKLEITMWFIFRINGNLVFESYRLCFFVLGFIRQWSGTWVANCKCTLYFICCHKTKKVGHKRI